MSRERWGSKSTFVLAAIGSAVGLGNVWRFPGQAFANGGGAFLVPYFIALITAGIPLLVLELAIGKKFQKGAPGALKSVYKKAEGLGWWAIATSFVITAYYCIIMSWAFNYLWHSLTLAWGSDSGSYFFGHVLKLTDSPGTLGGFNIPVLIGLILTWICVWVCIHNGTKSVGKIVKYTVPLPIIMLVLLGVRGLTLPGAINGLSYFLTPDWSALLDVNVWAAAYGQIFFSLSVLFGIMIAYSSMLPKETDIPSNALVIAFANSSISFLAGVTVFSTLGYLAHVQGVGISELGYSGVGLAFVTYPAVISQLPGGVIIQVIFALMFFIMLLTLGIDSAFSIVEGIVVALEDKFAWGKKKTVTIVCLAGFVAGLLFATNAGLYWLDIMDHWVNDFNLIVIGVFECIVVGWIYGADKLRKYFNEGSEVKLGKWWNIMIKYIIPVILFVITVIYLKTNISKAYGDYEMKYLLIGGWGMVLVTILAGVIVSMFKDSELSNE